MLGQFRILNVDVDNYDDLQVSSIQIETYKKEYCADVALPTSDVGAGDFSVGAFVQITAHSGGGQGSAMLIGSQRTIIEAAGADGDSVIFGSNAQWAGSDFGARGEIWNETDKIIDLFPNSGKEIIVAGTSLGANVALEIAPFQRINWLKDKDSNFRIR
jgi:hypothetical protein